MRWATTSASVSEVNCAPAAERRSRSAAWFSTIPLRTMWIRPAVSKWGWALSSVTRPWVAQRVWPIPIVGPASASATVLAARASWLGPDVTASRR